ncbi:MAG: hypothetical protein U0636_11380 [Phycisphaerales bacterium]
MKELHRHLVSVLLMAVLAMGGVGLRAAHVASSSPCSSDACSSHAQRGQGACAPRAAQPASQPGDHAPAHPADCQTCQQLEALAGTLPDALPPLAPAGLVAVLQQRSPCCAPAPLPLRAIAARPPPTC